MKLRVGAVKATRDPKTGKIRYEDVSVEELENALGSRFEELIDEIDKDAQETEKQEELSEGLERVNEVDENGIKEALQEFGECLGSSKTDNDIASCILNTVGNGNMGEDMTIKQCKCRDRVETLRTLFSEQFEKDKDISINDFINFDVTMMDYPAMVNEKVSYNEIVEIKRSKSGVKLIAQKLNNGNVRVALVSPILKKALEIEMDDIGSAYLEVLEWYKDLLTTPIGTFKELVSKDRLSFDTVQNDRVKYHSIRGIKEISVKVTATFGGLEYIGQDGFQDHSIKFNGSDDLNISQMLQHILQERLDMFNII